MNKAVLILPYFGKFPNYFQLFLNSCGKNKKIDFLIFTDQKFKNFKYANNIQFYNMNFSDMQKMSLEKLNVDFAISSPYKLCDFRPAYGIIFQNYISNYSYWGFCDCDLIFGNLDPIIKIFDKDYDQILSNGHLMFIKNIAYMNNLFSFNIKNGISFSDAIQKKEPCFFDEIFFPYIIKLKNYKIYENKTLFADVLPQNLKFVLPCNNLKNQTFVYSNGIIKRINDNKEYIYIHLQKRKMSVNIDLLSENYYINSNSFDYTNHDLIENEFVYKLKYYINIIKKINMRKLFIKFKTIIFKRVIRK